MKNQSIHAGSVFLFRMPITKKGLDFQGLRHDGWPKDVADPQQLIEDTHWMILVARERLTDLLSQLEKGQINSGSYRIKLPSWTSDLASQEAEKIANNQEVRDTEISPKLEDPAPSTKVSPESSPVPGGIQASTSEDAASNGSSASEDSEALRISMTNPAALERKKKYQRLATVLTLNHWFNLSSIGEYCWMAKNPDGDSILTMTSNDLERLAAIVEVMDWIKKVIESDKPQGYLGANHLVLFAQPLGGKQNWEWDFGLWDGAIAKVPYDHSKPAPKDGKTMGMMVNCLQPGSRNKKILGDLGLLLAMSKFERHPYGRMSLSNHVARMNKHAIADSADLEEMFFKGAEMAFVHELAHFVLHGGMPKLGDPILDLASQGPGKSYGLESISKAPLESQLFNAQNYAALVFNLWLNGEKYRWPYFVNNSGEHVDKNNVALPPITRVPFPPQCEWKIGPIVRRRTVVKSESQSVKQYLVSWIGCPYLT